MSFDYTVVAEVVAGSFILLAGIVAYYQFVRPASNKPSESEFKPEGRKYGARISFFGTANGNDSSPVPFEGRVLKIKTRNGKTDLEIEHSYTHEVKWLHGLVWGKNIRNAHANTPIEGVMMGDLLCNVDWDNGRFPFNPITVEAYRSSQDRILNERIKAQVEKEKSDDLEWRNLRANPDIAKDFDRLSGLRGNMPPMPPRNYP